MKVYALVNMCSGLVDGVYTLQGRKEKEEEFFAAACGRLKKHVDSLEADKKVYLEEAKALFWKAAMMPLEGNAEEVLSLLRQKDELVERRNEIEKEIDFLCNLCKEEVLDLYGTPHTWRTYELQGN